MGGRGAGGVSGTGMPGGGRRARSPPSRYPAAERDRRDSNGGSPVGRKRRGKRPQAGYVSKPMMPYSAPVDDDTGLPHEPGDPSHMRCPHCGLWGRSDDFLTAAQLTNVEDVDPKHSPNAVKPSSGPAVIPSSSIVRPMDPYDP